MKNNLKYWHKKLLNEEAYPYFKITNNIHDSGYRMFEFGYLTKSQCTTATVEEKIIIGSCADSIALDKCHIDVMNTDEICIMGIKKKWNFEHIGGVSSMELVGINNK